jgi:hypothetical protein
LGQLLDALRITRLQDRRERRDRLPQRRSCAERNCGRGIAAVVDPLLRTRQTVTKVGHVRLSSCQPTNRAHLVTPMREMSTPLVTDDRQQSPGASHTKSFLISRVGDLRVMPAKAGIQVGRGAHARAWIPAFAGMTERTRSILV